MAEKVKARHDKVQCILIKTSMWGNILSFNSLSKSNSNWKADTILIILGRISRTRFIMMPTQGEGRPCPTELTQQKTCPVTPCYSWVLGNWSACKLEVGCVTLRNAFQYIQSIYLANLCADGINFTAAGA